MEVLRLCRLSFLQADPCPACESLLLVLRTLGSWLALELLEGPLLFVRSCRIGNVSLVNSKLFTVLVVVLRLFQASPSTLLFLLQHR